MGWNDYPRHGKWIKPEEFKSDPIPTAQEFLAQAWEIYSPMDAAVEARMQHVALLLDFARTVHQLKTQRIPS